MQSLPTSLSEKAIDIIANFLSAKGTLLIICRGRNAEEQLDKVPYPLTKSDIMKFVDAGLSLEQFEDYFDEQDTPPGRRFRVTFKN